MFSFIRRNKVVIDIIAFFASVLASFYYWYDFFKEDEKWRWLGGIFFGIYAIVKLVDVIEYFRKKKRTVPEATLNNEEE